MYVPSPSVIPCVWEVLLPPEHERPANAAVAVAITNPQ